MDKYLFLYFTGTYNTSYLVNKFKEKLIKNYGVKEENISLVEINFKTPLLSYETLKDYNYIFFSYPIYAFNLPLLYERYLKRIKFPKTSHYFIIKQSGEYLFFNNASSRRIKDILRKQKIKVEQENHFLMPYNIHFKYENNLVKEMLLYLDKDVDIFLDNIKNNVSKVLKCNIFLRFIGWGFRLQRFGSIVNSYLYKVDYSKCIHCMKCLNNCPLNAISLKKEKFKFSKKCNMCMRCSFMCPKDAINIGFLQSWKVNGEYKYNNILENESIKCDFYLTNPKRDSFFYKSIKKKFNEIDEKKL